MAKIKVLKYNQALMVRMGLYSNHLTEPTNEFFNSPAVYYFFFVKILGALLSVIFVYKHWPQLDLVSQPILIATGCAGCFGMLLSIGIKSKSVKMLHLKLQEMADEAENEPAAYNIYWNAEQKCRQSTRVLIHVNLLNGILIIPIIQSTYDIFTGQYDTSDWILPFFLCVPFNTDSLWGWYPLLFIQINISFAYIIAMSAMVSYFVSCCFYVSAICEHFNLIIESVEKDIELNQHEKILFKFNKREKKITKNLCKAINLHIKVYEFFDLVADINSGVIFALLPTSVVYSALSFYNMENSELDTIMFAINIVGLSFGTCWSSLFAYFATFVTNRISDTGFTAYDCSWFNYPVELRKHMILIIARSQQPAQFTGLKLFPCTIELFGRLFKTSCSYYWAFRTLAHR